MITLKRKGPNLPFEFLFDNRQGSGTEFECQKKIDKHSKLEGFLTRKCGPFLKLTGRQFQMEEIGPMTWHLDI